MLLHPLWGKREDKNRLEKMKHIQFTGKNMQLGQALQAYATEEVSKLIEKYNLTPIHMHLWLEKSEHHHIKCEFLCHLKSSLHITVHANDRDVYKAFDKALQHFQKKIRRYKRRIDDHHKHHDSHKELKLQATAYTLSAEWDEGAHPDHPPVIAETPTEILSCSLGEAVMHLELSEKPFLLFRAKDVVNAIYRRDDGAIGWISPKIS